MGSLAHEKSFNVTFQRIHEFGVKNEKSKQTKGFQNVFSEYQKSRLVQITDTIQTSNENPPYDWPEEIDILWHGPPLKCRQLFIKTGETVI